MNNTKIQADEEESDEGPQRTKSLKEIMKDRDRNSLPSKDGVKRSYTSRRDFQLAYSDDEDDA